MSPSPALASCARRYRHNGTKSMLFTFKGTGDRGSSNRRAAPLRLRHVFCLCLFIPTAAFARMYGLLHSSDPFGEFYPLLQHRPMSKDCATTIGLTEILQRFLRDGCPNCESFLGLVNSTDAVQECTSQVFEGLITVADPDNSWVARWQRLGGYIPGVYTVKVVGTVSATDDCGIIGIWRHCASITTNRGSKLFPQFYIPDLF